MEDQQRSSNYITLVERVIMNKHIPFLMKVNSNDPFFQELIELGIIHKVNEEEIRNSLVKSKEQMDQMGSPIKVKAPKFSISIEDRYIVTPDGKEIKITDLLKSKE